MRLLHRPDLLACLPLAAFAFAGFAGAQERRASNTGDSATMSIARSVGKDLTRFSQEGHIAAGPDAESLLLCTPREALLVFKAKNSADRSVPAGTVRLTGLKLPPGVDYQLRLWNPAEQDDIAARQITIHRDGEAQFLLPQFDGPIVALIEPRRIGVPAAQGVPDAPGSGNPVAFTKIVLTHEYLSDGIDVGDINRDGDLDIVSGPYWYAGPEFRERAALYPPERLVPEQSPSNSMFSFVHDFSRDGWPDVLVLGRVHLHAAYWYENPGTDEGAPWRKHFAFERVRGESPQLVDLDGDGTPQVICHWEGSWGWIEPHPQQPRRPWRFVPISPPADWPQFYHGEGVGDLDADGQLDLLINDGWFSRGGHDSSAWRFTENRFSQGKGGAQMFVDDVDRDGDKDVITAIDAHGYGISWFERISAEDQPRFQEHPIMGTREQIAQFGAAFSQPHALAYADIDGDGLSDLIAGKRVWAHGPTGDVEPSAPPVVYWFQRTLEPDGIVRFIPHQVDDASGVGTQIQAVDVNADGRTDILTASKLGSFLFLNSAH